jgi:hypothetical protein
MRPSTLISVILAIVIFLGGLALGILAFVARGSGKPWFYWIAPLLALGFAGMMIQLVVQYWLKVGRLEVKGRPRSD